MLSPHLIVGICLLCAGVVTVWKRKAFNDYMYASQKRMFGEKAARASAGRQTSSMMGVVGVLIASLGAGMFTLGVIAIL